MDKGSAQTGSFTYQTIKYDQNFTATDSGLHINTIVTSIHVALNQLF